MNAGAGRQLVPAGLACGPVNPAMVRADEVRRPLTNLVAIKALKKHASLWV